MDSKAIQDYVSVFHELMIVILRRRSFFQLFENTLKNKRVDDDRVIKNAFVSYYLMDYARSQLIDLRKFFETDSQSYKISKLLSLAVNNALTARYGMLDRKWRNKFKPQVNKLIAHIDKDSKNLIKQVRKQDLDELINEVNSFLDDIIKDIRSKGVLSLNDSLRDPNGNLLVVEQEVQFKELQGWLSH